VGRARLVPAGRRSGHTGGDAELVADVGPRVLELNLVGLGKVVLHEVEEGVVVLLRDARIADDQHADIAQLLRHLQRERAPPLARRRRSTVIERRAAGGDAARRGRTWRHASRSSGVRASPSAAGGAARKAVTSTTGSAILSADSRSARGLQAEHQHRQHQQQHQHQHRQHQHQRREQQHRQQQHQQRKRRRRREVTRRTRPVFFSDARAHKSTDKDDRRAPSGGYAAHADARAGCSAPRGDSFFRPLAARPVHVV